MVPQPEESVDLNQLQNLVSGEGNAMAKLFETGNSVLAIGLAANVASTLNSLQDNTTSNDSSSTPQKDSSKQVRLRSHCSESNCAITYILRVKMNK